MTNQYWTWSIARVIWLALLGAACSNAKPADPEIAVEPNTAAYAPVAAYLAAFNAQSFDDAADFATDDWNMIGPTGVWSRDRDEVVASEKELSKVILKGVTLTVLNTVVAYASRDVAVITQTTRANDYPASEALERTTYVVVQRDGKWWLLQTQVTTIAEGVSADEAPARIGEPPTDVGGELESAEIRQEKAHLSAAWLDGLPVSHDFDHAADFTTDDWSLITPIGFWTEGREASLASVEQAFTTFLDGMVITEDQVVASFPTDDVVLLTAARTDVLADQAGNDVATLLSVNHGGHWLAMHRQITNLP